MLVVGEKVYLRFFGGFEDMCFLGDFWTILAVFWLVPKPLRDVIYNYIAKDRYKWFGKRNECIMPTFGIKRSFWNESFTMLK